MFSDGETNASDTGALSLDGAENAVVRSIVFYEGHLICQDRLSRRKKYQNQFERRFAQFQ
jgi:hypothetical protein